MNRPRRHAIVALLAISLLSGAMWQLGVGWIGWQRQRIVAKLSQEILSNDEGRAVAAINSLARLNEEGARPLVAAALESRPRVAPAARWAVNDMLARWHRESQQGSNKRRIAARLDRLAAALADHLSGRTPEQLLWARQLAEQILRVTSDVPAGKRMGIVDCCSGVLHFTSDLASTDHLAPDKSPVETDEPRRIQPSEQASTTQIQTANPVRVGATNAPPLSDQREPIGSVRARFADPRTTPTESGGTVTNTPAGSVRWQPDRAVADSATRRELSWVDPADSATPVASSPQRQFAAGAATGPISEVPPTEESPAQRRTTGQQLLHKLARAYAVDVAPIQDELADRGLGRVSPALARMMISESAAERIRAVDTLLQTPGVRPGPWLIMFAEDPDADVRLAVISLLATSNDPVLVEKAWEVALRDEDPRVARMADWLQAKRRR